MSPDGIRPRGPGIILSLRNIAAFVHAALLARAVFRDGSEALRIAAFLGEGAGVFVEVGANDPIVGSQSHALEQRGWSGILVEPLGEYAERLRAVRRATVFECAAGSPAQAGRKLPLLVAGGLSTLSARIEEPVTARETRLVPVRTLDALLAEAGISHVDFLSIDVEGAEIAVLEGFAIERVRPRLVLVEDDARTLDKHRHLAARGYKLVRRTALNNWYVPAESAFPLSLRGRWQLFRKMRLAAPLRRWKARRRARRRPDLPPAG